MILPESFAVVLLLAVLATLCWSAWPVTFKMASDRRFELYYLDFALGAAVTAALAGLTLGTLGGDITLMDNLAIAGRRELAFAFAAGAILNFGNMLVVAGMSLAGASISFSIAAGAAAFLTLVWRSIAHPPAAMALVGAAAMAAVVAVVCGAKAFGIIQEAMQPAAPPISSKLVRPKAKKGPGLWKGVALATVGGLAMAASLPLFSVARQGIIELSAYGIGLLAGAGLIASTLFFNIWFMNLPVQGAPASFLDYPGGARNHVLGVLGGAIWCCGMLMFQLAVGAPATAGVSAAHIEVLRHGSPVLAGLVGWLACRERGEQSPRARLFVSVSMALLVLALALGFLLG